MITTSEQLHWIVGDFGIGTTESEYCRSARVDQLVLDVKAIGARTGKLTDDMREVRAELNELHDLVVKLRAHHDGHIAFHAAQRTFWQRLLWLVRG